MDINIYVRKQNGGNPAPHPCRTWQPVAAIIPSDSNLNVEFTAADFSLWAKTAQVGGTLRYSAPVMTCQNVTATGTALTIDVGAGVPVAQLGFREPFCYVQEVGKAAPIATYGTAYGITAAGAVEDFTATAGTTYKVWYFVNKASAQMARLFLHLPHHHPSPPSTRSLSYRAALVVEIC